MWWIVALVIIATGALIWLGRMFERERIRAETDAEIVTLKNEVQIKRTEVAGMSEEELDILVYGSDSVTPTPKAKTEFWD